MKMKDEGIAATLRRDFLSALCVGLGGLATCILAIPVVGFWVAPLLRNVPKRWRPVGPVDSFPIGKMVLVSFDDPSPLPWGGVTAKSAAYVQHTSETTWEAFSIHCTHLGCPVRWLPDAKLFMCPCHGGVYYANGSVAAGPPPRHLIHMELRERAGQLEILTVPTPIT
jgi:menaquinol-cytochrome c reductase iron-sulfur subunit